MPHRSRAWPCRVRRGWEQGCRRVLAADCPVAQPMEGCQEPAARSRRRLRRQPSPAQLPQGARRPARAAAAGCPALALPPAIPQAAAASRSVWRPAAASRAVRCPAGPQRACREASSEPIQRRGWGILCSVGRPLMRARAPPPTKSRSGEKKEAQCAVLSNRLRARQDKATRVELCARPAHLPNTKRIPKLLSNQGCCKWHIPTAPPYQTYLRTDQSNNACTHCLAKR